MQKCVFILCRYVRRVCGKNGTNLCAETIQGVRAPLHSIFRFKHWRTMMFTATKLGLKCV